MASPITKLSADVLSLIFLLCLPDHTWDDPGPGLSHIHPSVVLSHVCHDWRQAVLGNPQSWSNLYINVPGTEEFNVDLQSWKVAVQAMTDKVLIWQRRAGHTPLCLLLHIPKLRFGAQLTMTHLYQDLLEAVFLCHSQIQCMDIRVSYDSDALGSLTDIFSHYMIDGLPLLCSFTAQTFGRASLHVNMSEIADWMTSAMLHRLLSSAPLLRRLSLSGVWGLSPRWLAGKIENWICLARLTHLAVDKYSRDRGYDPFDGSSMLTLLEACPNLVEAAFVLQNEQGRNAKIPKTPITLPHLERLSLQGVPLKPSFLPLLRLPLLKAAYLVCDEFTRLGGHGRFTPSDPEGIIEFIRRFGPQLSQVAINPDILSPSDLTSCLELVDKVEVLSLIRPDFPLSLAGSSVSWVRLEDDTDYCSLAHIAKESVFPNLQHLEMEIRNPRISGQCEGALVDLIANRRRNIADIEGAEGEGRMAGQGGEEGRVEPVARTCITDVHIIFSYAQRVGIVQELDERGVDLDIDPFNLRVVYPGATGSLGTLSDRPWTPLRHD